MGETSRLLGDYEQAGNLYGQNIELLRKLRSPFHLVGRIINLVWVSLHGGDYQKARALFEESLNLFKEDGNKNAMIDCFTGATANPEVIGKHVKAAKVFGAVAPTFETIGRARRMDPSDQKDFDHYITLVRSQLDENAFSEACEKGRAMAVEQVIELVRKESEL